MKIAHRLRLAAIQSRRDRAEIGTLRAGIGYAHGVITKDAALKHRSLCTMLVEICALRVADNELAAATWGTSK